MILVLFQTTIPKRFSIVKLDEVLSWTASLTPTEFDLLHDPILDEPFLRYYTSSIVLIWIKR